MSETGNNRVQIFSAKGESIKIFGSPGPDGRCGRGKFIRPAGVAVAKDGRIVVADPQNSRVQIFSKQGKFLEVLTGCQNYGLSYFWNRYGEDPLKNPHSLLLDSEGKILVLDQTNRIKIFGKK